MKYIHQNSLAETLDSISDDLFFGRDIPGPESLEAGKWLAARQGLPGSYANMFAPTKLDLQKGIRLFTGEQVYTRAGISHILGQETCRILAKLNLKEKNIIKARAEALTSITARIDSYNGKLKGFYCCGKCSTAYLRNIAASNFPRKDERFADGMKEIKKRRLGNGRWSCFSFYYLSLALTEIGSGPAKDEMRYAAPAWEKYLKNNRRAGEKYIKRRLSVGKKLLELC